VLSRKVQSRERAWPSRRLGSWLRVIFANDGTAPAVFVLWGGGGIALLACMGLRLPDDVWRGSP